MPAIRYGRKFTLSYNSAKTIKSVAMIRAGSVTHSFDQSQRYVPLSFSTSGNKLTIKGPKNKNQAPPGQYMLVIIDSNGVPSQAELFQPS